MKIAANNKPFIGRSTTIISHFRNTRELLLYYFLLDATDETPDKRVVWSNQQIFNYLSFEFEARYVEPETMPDRPTYVHDFKYGIVGGKVDVNVFDYNKVSAGHRGAYNYTCPGISVLNPKQLMNCSIPDNPFKTLIEHGDSMEVTLTAYSGGQRKILLPDGNLRTENIIGTEYKKQLEFKFDFEPAVHCSNYSTFNCQPGATVLKATSEFTKTPIVLEWKGWVERDQYSAGVGAYRLELHRLEVKDATLELTEANPTLPLMENRVNHTGDTTVQNLFRTTFTPPEPGMYSIVMEVTDNANNSIFTRRFALYDNVSNVTANPLSAHGVHATSAAPETGYRWQTVTDLVKLDWTDYFVNKVHHEKKFLNKIRKFPTLFTDLELIGIRNVEKFVFDSYDDTESNRTRDAIPNVNGITRFQYGYVVNQTTGSAQAPAVWNTISGLNQKIDVSVLTRNGDTVTLWVRAFDILGNTLEKHTTVTIDDTPPLIVTSLAENKTSTFTPNAGKTDGGYLYSSYEFYARDTESGVYQIELDIAITMTDIGVVRSFRQVVNASMDKTKAPTDPACVPSKDPDTCFLERQKVRMDNCWFLVPKKDYIINAGATVSVSVYNQARLAVNTQFEIKKLNTLNGLEIYSGPENIRITNMRPDSFRILWDLPSVRACYDSAPIVINIAFSSATEPRKHYLPSTTTFLDVAGLTPDTLYQISFYTQLGNSQADLSEAFAQKSVKTGKPDETGLSAGVVAGVAIGVIAFVIICIIVMVVLVRMGVIKNPEPVARVTRAVTRRYRQSRYGAGAESTQAPFRPPKSVENPSYSANTNKIKIYDNNRPLSEDIYLPGGADVNVVDVPLQRRSDITLDSKISTGRFAYIYKATLERGSHRETVVAKTLKENFNDNDRNLMNTKINFLGNYVGNHPNILKFIAAVTDDHMIGPFIVHEHCENGTLKDYLVKQRDHVTIQLQDNLFRFGLDVAKGMEYLASKSVVHRRLAARNVLLNFLYEVKITGFGPQPAHNEEGGVAEEEENIPIKWVAPECMKSTRDATERSDVWSYAVTLWEIFSLGQTPYGKIQSRDVPTRIKKGLRLEKPEQCDDTWYAVMMRCWSYEANRRPNFEEIREELDNLFAPRDGEMDTYYYTRR